MTEPDQFILRLQHSKLEEINTSSEATRTAFNMKFNHGGRIGALTGPPWSAETTHWLLRVLDGQPYVLLNFFQPISLARVT